MNLLVRLDEKKVSHDIELVDDRETDWVDDCSEPEVELATEVEQSHEQDLTYQRVHEWLHDLPADPKETVPVLTI